MNFRLVYHILILAMVLAVSAPATNVSGQVDIFAGTDEDIGPAAETTSIPLTGINAISVGIGHSCALAPDGVKCWGANFAGQLGNGNAPTDSSIPVDVVGLGTGFQTIAAGGYHTCALTTGGGVKCWGDNLFGQLGNGNSPTDSDTPVDVVGLSSGVQVIVSGRYHTCVVTSGGAVKCWGVNGNGQLGDNTTTDSDTPVDVVGLSSGVQTVAAGAAHSCALTTGGGVKCWGINDDGQLGDKSTVRSYIPVDVIGLSSGVEAITAGNFHTCALTTGGGVKCWGDNSTGQIGNSDAPTDRDTPVDVDNLGSGVHAITAGSLHSCALTEAGGIKCWGDNFAGQLGNNDAPNDRDTPVDVVNLTHWSYAVEAGGSHTCALSQEGGVKCWGYNTSAQLGDGTTIDRSLPGDVVTIATCYHLIRIKTGLGNSPVADPDRTPGCSENHYLEGENIALFADANNGWRVNGWSGTSNDISLNQVNSLTMPAQDTTVSVSYTGCRPLTTSHEGQGGDPVPAPGNSVNCPSGTYAQGEIITLIAKPDANQRVKEWTGTDTTPDAGALVNTLTMPNSTSAVKATYEACNQLTVQVSGRGQSLSAIPAASTGCAAGHYASGQSITLTAAPASGWTVDEWSGTNNDDSTARTNNLTMPEGDHTVTVTYAEQEESYFLPGLQG